MTTRTRRLTTNALLLLVIALAAVAVVVALWVPQPKRYEAREGRPLLEQDGAYFQDDQVGIQFDAPTEWGMQVRSTEGPQHRSERLLVKYKRVLPSKPMAWLRVRVIDVPPEQSLEDYLKARKSPESDWLPECEIETNLKFGGQPAARRRYAGPYNSDGRGNKPFYCEVTAIRKGSRVFDFAGSYDATDDAALEQIHAVLASVTFP